jgi:transcriptional regulator with XRE-family HTH domain
MPRAHEPQYRHLRARLLRAREDRGLTVAEIDTLLDRIPGTCARWENDEQTIDLYSLRRFAAVVQVPMQWLVDGGGSVPYRHPPVHSVRDALIAAGPKAVPNLNKKNWSERFSRALAIAFANALRRDFDGITPDEYGGRQERPARTNRGFKKLDVGYSTEDLGLALGVSLKSINFRDDDTGRYTKNYTRNDNELRAEAMDYHRRQPYAVLAGVLMLPIDSCDDASLAPNAESSFAAAVRTFKKRTGRIPPLGDSDLLEVFFMGLYDIDDVDGANNIFFDVNDAPSRRGRPAVGLTLEEVVQSIKSRYDEINFLPFEYAQPE